MHPILLRLGTLDIHTYGVLVAMGFMVGLAVAAQRAKLERIHPDRIGDLGVWLVVAGMLGGKLFHIAFFWSDFVAAWRERGIGSLREGFVFYGGFIAASVTVLVFAHVKKLPWAKLADVLAPSVAIGHFFGRLGCFFEGCCYGNACTAPWAVHYPDRHPMHNIPAHPVQLYEAFGNLLIFFGLLAAYRYKKQDGQIWWLYVLVYGTLRLVTESFRGDYFSFVFDRVTIGQVVAVVMVIVAVLGLRLSRSVRT
jgi:phosphatidylglycerol---prolipoprotein diacylglyceryl transferase